MSKEYCPSCGAATCRTPYCSNCGTCLTESAPQPMQIDEQIQEGKALSVAKWNVDTGIKGGIGFKGAEDLANEYLRNPKYSNDDHRINVLIRTQVAWNAGTGFATGLPGFVALPVTIPASLASSALIQTRLAAAIAIIRGYDPDSEEVRTAG